MAYIGEENYFIGLQTLCINKNILTAFGGGQALVAEVTNFQVFMTVMTAAETSEKKRAVIDVLQLLFPGQQVSFVGDTSIVFMKNGQAVMVDENNFPAFQAAIQEIGQINFSAAEEKDYNPANEKARKILEKMKQNAEKIARQQSVSKITSFFAQQISVLSIALHKTPNELRQLTQFQLYDLSQRLSLWMAWDIDLRAKLAGSTEKTSVENWMKDLYDETN